MRVINKIVLHCLGISYGNVLSIDKLHRQRNPPFDEIGYHDIILNAYPFSPDSKVEIYDGMIHPGRPLEKQGAHVYGYNKHSLGICFVGEPGQFSKKQLTSSRVLTLLRLKQFGLSIDDVVGHYELDPVNKSYCPGIKMDDFRDFLNNPEHIKLFDPEYII